MNCFVLPRSACGPRITPRAGSHTTDFSFRRNKGFRDKGRTARYCSRGDKAGRAELKLPRFRGAQKKKARSGQILLLPPSLCAGVSPASCCYSDVLPKLGPPFFPGVRAPGGGRAILPARAKHRRSCMPCHHLFLWNLYVRRKSSCCIAAEPVARRIPTSQDQPNGRSDLFRQVEGRVRQRFIHD